MRVSVAGVSVGVTGVRRHHGTAADAARLHATWLSCSRVDLSREAIDLGRALAQLMPDEGEVLALLALMLLHDARRAARVRHGQVVPLDEQDRSRWNEPQIAEGRRVLATALSGGRNGPTSSGPQSPSCASTSRDWPQIAALYEPLARQTGSAG